MSREIDIRFWNKTENRMEYFLKDFKDINFVDGEWKPVIQTFEWYKYNYEMMQYTGLKDKNGKKIYEGDIAGAYGSNKEDCFTGEVVYNDAWCCFELRKFEYCEEIETHGYITCPLHGLFVEVIGNIYKNPELLEG